MTIYPVQKSSVRAVVVGMRRLGEPVEEHLAAGRLTLADIAGPGTIPWEAPAPAGSFVAFVAAFAAGKSDATIAALGAEYTAAFPAIQALAGLLVPIRVLYKVIGQSDSLWPMYRFSCVEDGGASLRYAMHLVPEAPPCRPHVVATTSLLRVLPGRLGLPHADVETLELTERGATWRITPPPQRLFVTAPVASLVDLARVARAVFHGEPAAQGRDADVAVAHASATIPSLMATYGWTLTEARIAKSMAQTGSVEETAKDLRLKRAFVAAKVAQIQAESLPARATSKEAVQETTRDDESFAATDRTPSVARGHREQS